MATEPINRNFAIEPRPSIVPVTRKLKDGPVMMADET